MKLATMYIKRVGTELQLVRSSDKESAQEALLLQGMHFAYRVNQVFLKSPHLQEKNPCLLKKNKGRGKKLPSFLFRQVNYQNINSMKFIKSIET